MASRSVTLTTRLTPDTMSLMDSISSETGLSKSTIINLLLEELVEEYKEHNMDAAHIWRRLRGL